MSDSYIKDLLQERKEIKEKLEKALEQYFDCTGHGPDHCMHCAIEAIVKELKGEKL